MSKLQLEIDAIMRSREKVIGNIAWFPPQVYYYARESSQSWIHNICEVGYGAGHSAILYLSVNGKANLYSFDIFANLPAQRSFRNTRALTLPKTYQSSTLSLIARTPDFANRFQKIAGDSNVTLPAFVKENPQLKCDFISIDGSHVPPQPYFDILNLRPLAHNRTIVVLDDMHSNLMRNDFDRAITSKLLIQYECLTPEYRTDMRFASYTTSIKVFCAARYV
ncbi:unnamed protein product [Rotaria socialis]|uniref:Class I SAM-dependent methyltransferase n=1 Tax=Rotaria socialis TaxID=392032 RepID=A0A817QEH9_9BILA|nr:unnamed protein product [Rotaria socialis]CAF4468069.1 unnamed protein product [Rotaria socialis]